MIGCENVPFICQFVVECPVYQYQILDAIYHSFVPQVEARFTVSIPTAHVWCRVVWMDTWSVITASLAGTRGRGERETRGTSASGESTLQILQATWYAIVGHTRGNGHTAVTSAARLFLTEAVWRSTTVFTPARDRTRVTSVGRRSHQSLPCVNTDVSTLGRGSVSVSSAAPRLPWWVITPHIWSLTMAWRRTSASCARSGSLHARGLTQHTWTHTGERPYGCSICPARFTVKSNLNRHVISIHTHDYKHRCSRCGKGFYVRTELHRHNRTHGSDACMGQDRLDGHAKHRHGVISRNQRHKCEWCEYSTDQCIATWHVIVGHTRANNRTAVATVARHLLFGVV